MPLLFADEHTCLHARIQLQRPTNLHAQARRHGCMLAQATASLHKCMQKGALEGISLLEPVSLKASENACNWTPGRAIALQRQ